MTAPRPIGRRDSLWSLTNDFFKKIEELSGAKNTRVEDSQKQENPSARPSSSHDNHLR